MSKLEVIEIDVAKLDPNAVHLIVFNVTLLTREWRESIVKELREHNIRAVFADSVNPQEALKVYEIPKEDK